MKLLHKQQEQEAVERCLPACLILTAMGQMKGSVECREDVLRNLNVASVSPLSQFDTLTIARLAKRVSDTAQSLLRDASVGDTIDGLMSAVQFTLLLADKGFIRDPQNMGVLVALLLHEDMTDDTQGDPSFPIRKAVWEAGGNKLLTRALLLGLFQRPLPAPGQQVH